MANPWKINYSSDAPWGMFWPAYLTSPSSLACDINWDFTSRKKKFRKKQTLCKMVGSVVSCRVRRMAWWQWSPICWQDLNRETKEDRKPLPSLDQEQKKSENNANDGKQYLLCFLEEKKNFRKEQIYWLIHSTVKTSLWKATLYHN